MNALCFTSTRRNMSSTQETLFSLELVIDYVRFDGSRGSVLAPAVGVRFLDFPTLLIYQSGQEDPSSKSGHTDLCVSTEALSQQDDLKYSFHKGKSCLFKMNLDSLHNHLLSTPLYAMVLDVKDEIPKLIGSSLISLAKVMERIKMDVGQHGVGSPSAYGERLLTSVCNLMGKSIGAISLAYKIVSLGAHLIPHIAENRVYEVGVTRGRAEQHESVRAKCEMSPKASENHRGNVLSPQISLDGQSAEAVILEEKQPGLSAVTPTEQRVSWCEDAQEYTEFCPPPLFYSSGPKNQQERKSFTGLLAAIESLNMEDPEDENNEDMLDFPETSAVKQDRSSNLTLTPRPRHEETDSAPLGNVIGQLPLLNALLVELSQLNGQTQPLSVHPHLAWLYSSPPGAETENQKTLKAGPKRKIKGGVKSAKSASGAKRNEEKLQPKRTLQYGLTKTFCLRLKLVKAGLTNRHECIQYRNIKQDPPVRQTPSDHKRVRKPVQRSHNLDETIETLVSSFEMDPTPMKPASRSQSLVKHETILDERNKNVRVHIPSALSDRSERLSDSHNPGVQSFKESRSNLSNGSFEQEEYPDDFTSLNTTDGYSPDPLSSPEPNRRKTSGSSTSSQNRGLPVPVKAENSPQRSLKGTHVIRPRLQTSALSLSSDDSEDEFASSGSGRRRRPGSRSSGHKTPSVRRTFGKPENLDGGPADKSMTFSQVSKDSDLRAINSSDVGEERDKPGTLGLDRNCHHISELVFNKLPGYTL